MNIKALIVDDEPKARQVLKIALNEYLPYVTVVDSVENIPQAVRAIQQHEPDLVFLDIEMPGFSGLQLFEFYDEPPFQAIITSAYGLHFEDEIKKRNLKYLLKPIQIDQLVKTVNGMFVKKNEDK
jgi:two-component system, LytTR family, response regulator